MNSLHVRAWALWAVLAIGTALIIRFSYDPITLYQVPYARASLLLTILTWLSAQSSMSQSSCGTTLVYALIFMPCYFVLVLPNEVLPFRIAVGGMVVGWHGLGYKLCVLWAQEEKRTVKA